MSSKKKKGGSTKPATAPAAAPVAAPVETVGQDESPDHGAGRLGLYIAVIGIVLVLGAGGLFVFLNNQAGATTGSSAPHLASGWAPGPTNVCKGSPKFPTQLGFSRNVVFSTSERLNKGMALIEPGANNDLSTGRTYQDPTWTQGGYLGVFVADRDGNVFVAPSPRISLLDNPPEKGNILYKIDTNTGKMSEYLDLPAGAPPSPENPYGILAVTYDCDTNSLYATSVMGSTHDKTAGRIYRIDLSTGKVASEYDNVDAFGISTFNQADGKRLYYGAARTPDIYSIALDGQGNFSGEPRQEFFLNGPFNRPRRIDFNNTGQMLVRGIDFDFTLSAVSEDRTTNYVFDQDPATAKWTQIAP